MVAARPTHKTPPPRCVARAARHLRRGDGAHDGAGGAGIHTAAAAGGAAAVAAAGGGAALAAGGAGGGACGLSYKDRMTEGGDRLRGFCLVHFVRH